MNIIQNVDQNIYYSLLLIIVMIVTTKKLPHKNRVVKTINIISILTIIAAIGEGITENGILLARPLTEIEKTIYHISSTITATLALIVTASWLYFVYLYINRYREIKEKVLTIIRIPVILLLPIVISSPFSKLMVDLQFPDTGMIYGRGKLYFLIVAAEMLYIILAAIYVFKKRKELNKTEFILLLALEVLPIVGTIIQMVFPHMLYIFSSGIFTIVLAYLLLKDKISDRDEITLAKTPAAFSVMLKSKKPHDYIVAYVRLADYIDIRKRSGKANQLLYLKKFSRTVLDSLEPGIDFIYMSDCKFVFYFNNSNTIAAEKFLYRIREKLLNLKNEKFNYKFDFNLTVVNKENYAESDLLKTAYVEFYESNKEVEQC